MPTTFKETQGSGMLESKQHTVQEPVEEVIDMVNKALKEKTEFVTVTGEDGKKYSVTARRIRNIREV